MYKYSKIQENPLLHLCLSEPLRLGKAVILRESAHGMLTCCPSARFHCLAADSLSAGEALLSGIHNLSFIMLTDAALSPLLRRFGLRHSMRCHQAAYLRPELPPQDARLRITIPDDSAFARILENYHMDTPEELRRRREAGELFFARTPDGQDVGFAGLHPEGCFGLLHIFPSQRGKGYGAALENHLLRFCLEQGRIPYCQVEEDNLPSLALQRKLGLEITPETMLMAWNDFE